MAFGKTEEQKAAETQQKAEQAYWTSPVGQAQRARQDGARFFQIEIPHSTVSGYANAMWSANGASQKVTQHGGAPDVLGQIEEAGWRLEHVSHVFMETGQSSRDKFMASGQQVVVQGKVVGIYLFRAA